MRFAIFTHVEHIEREGRYYAYAPYVREMNVWLEQVEEVEVIGAKRQRNPGSGGLGENGIGYNHSKLTFTEVPAFHFLNFSSAIKAIIKFPYIFFRMMGAMRRADHLHLRCPGNVGLLACIAQLFFPSKSKTAKYAGNWDPQAKQPLSYKFQKWLLSNTFLTRNMRVLVYGEWSGQSENVFPFFTASFAENDVAEVQAKQFSEPLTFLFVGNLVEGKQPMEAIKLVERINAAGETGPNQEILGKGNVLEIYGDGPERERLQDYCKKHFLDDIIHFKRNRPLEELKAAYRKAHFVVLPSISEGWPKAIAEGMFFGCIPIATPVSCVPRMLGNGKRGILLTDPPLETFQKSRQLECSSDPAAAGSKNVSRTSLSEPPAYRRGKLEVTERDFSIERKVLDQRTEDVKKISQLMSDRGKLERMSMEAKEWSQQYTLERFEAAIKEVLRKSNEKKNLSPEERRERGMRVLQLIDSLRPGGAEKMSVSYANALAKRIDASFLCCTRLEGLLKPQLSSQVGYLFLERGGTFDWKAFWKLRKFIKDNKVNLVQTHGSSWFMGVLIKISLPQIKLVWHDHFGARIHRNRRPNLLLPFSLYFDGIITVNPGLKEWADKNLYCDKVKFIPNFITSNTEPSTSKSLKINSGFKIVYLANLKAPKDHFTLLKAFLKLTEKNFPVSLHLIGKDENDGYSEQIRKFTIDNNLSDKIFIYGEQNEVEALLKQADLGVISSESEGMPVALLEYGQVGLPVVCTRVGECEGVIGGAGLLVPSGDPEALFQALEFYIENEFKRKKDAVDFHKRIAEVYSEEAVMGQLLSFYRGSILNSHGVI